VRNPNASPETKCLLFQHQTSARRVQPRPRSFGCAAISAHFTPNTVFTSSAQIFVPLTILKPLRLPFSGPGWIRTTRGGRGSCTRHWVAAVDASSENIVEDVTTPTSKQVLSIDTFAPISQTRPQPHAARGAFKAGNKAKSRASYKEDSHQPGPRTEGADQKLVLKRYPNARVSVPSSPPVGRIVALLKGETVEMSKGKILTFAAILGVAGTSNVLARADEPIPEECYRVQQQPKKPLD
jgi:hypothetical protein